MDVDSAGTYGQIVATLSGGHKATLAGDQWVKRANQFRSHPCLPKAKGFQMSKKRLKLCLLTAAISVAASTSASASTPAAYWGNDARSYYPANNTAYQSMGSGGQWNAELDGNNTQGVYMFNQATATNKRVRVVSGTYPNLGNVAGWWNTSTIQDFAITWSPRGWLHTQCNAMNGPANVNCGHIRYN